MLQLIAAKRANFIEEEGGDVKYDLIKSKHDDLNYAGEGLRCKELMCVRVPD